MTSSKRPSQQRKAEGSAAFTSRSTQKELYARGKGLRSKCPRSSHAAWKPPQSRLDPIQLVEEANVGRIPELVPIRHGRMMQSPFTFYRGIALNMASDLAVTPVTGVCVQVCGDAHLGNFRCFATPERRVNFDIHDLDETLPGPWEWDVKRLAASFVLASRNNNLSEKSARDAVLACVRSYREHMSKFSKMRTLDIWYARFEAETLIEKLGNPDTRRSARKILTKARERSVLEHDFPKLVQGTIPPRIKDNPPTIYHWREQGHEEFSALVRDAFDRYGRTLAADRRVLLGRFVLQDIAIKVVGVGSVGTLCFVVLMMAGARDPLFLQLKQARPSVLEAYAGKSIYPNHGQRVVVGHRLMQSASDIFLGWTEAKFGHYYVRQLRDVKIKFDVERFDASQMFQFAEFCGSTLARAHARSGEPAMISGYLGKGDVFDKAIAAFSVAYADQTERDYERFKNAVRKGRLKAIVER